MGTVGYMAPEQVRGAAVDNRTDIFSLGAVLYEMVSGKQAFRRDTAAETMTAILKEDPPELDEATQPVSPGIQRIISTLSGEKTGATISVGKRFGFCARGDNRNGHKIGREPRNCRSGKTTIRCGHGYYPQLEFYWH